VLLLTCDFPLQRGYCGTAEGSKIQHATLINANFGKAKPYGKASRRLQCDGKVLYSTRKFWETWFKIVRGRPCFTEKL
jgi:hypothetical protein